jgi:Ni,Fe-hydrogenase I small subunit
MQESMASETLHSILNKKLDNYIVCDGTINNHTYYIISFDEELFESTLRDFEASYSAIIEKFDKESTLSILPDFLE